MTSSWPLLPSTHAFFFCTSESLCKDAQESMASIDQASLGVWNVSILGREHKGPSDAAQLAPEDLIARVHDSLEHNFLGRQYGDPCRKPVLRNFILNPDANTVESTALVCSSAIANRCGHRIASMS